MPARTSSKTVARSISTKSSKKAVAPPKKAGKPSKLAKAGKAVAKASKAVAKAGKAVAKASKAVVKKAAPKKKAPALKAYDAAAVKATAKASEKWAKEELAQITSKMPLRRKQFVTDSGIPIPDLTTLADRKDEQLERIGLPGQFPFTRGTQPTMYRGRLWTMRQFAGFGTPADTNKRFKYLISHGMTGLSTAFDMPALMGYDADHSMSRGEVGKEGVAISSLRDFEILFDGIQLDKVTTSMTINASAIVALCMYIAVGEKQGIPMSKLAGTIQNDMLKEYIAQKEWIVAPRPAVRIVTDMIEFCTKNMPKWYPVSISGYHIREAGATAVQELAFTLADGIGYVEECVKRGMDVDAFAPQLSFFWDVHNDFFEEIAKFRAARRIWANVLRYRFGAKNPRSWQLKTHAQTAGVSLTAQQPYNNVVRTALQAMAAVLGGTQSLHTNSLDETYALPTEESVTIALRTQQLIAHESGVDRVVDPLAGSYYVEYLTDEMEKRAMEYIRRIDEMGGIIRAVEEQYPQKEIGESAYRFQREVEQGDRLIVGVNAFKSEKDAPIELLHIDDKVAEEQKARLAQVKAERNNEAVQAALAKVEAAARGTDNMMPPVLEAVKAYATLGEICDVFRKVWGQYREGGAF
ncbi:acyl-CoA mutase large subunit family protein [Hyalangium rubrum]|uniref:Methylmalonyl-CoA mutase family protein n=1 Tax=Hyalangium rubrum TaxID=3103134 RepID=A0ABU5HHA6_9BACT|nr:methylmalonyl-CoA mutase family protein [Hyalangium sp. s54d21]MDY7232853.1 methylmalonyl-CoA mutase family protein [Hyalangium sp. s54d21]